MNKHEKQMHLQCEVSNKNLEKMLTDTANVDGDLGMIIPGALPNTVVKKEVDGDVPKMESMLVSLELTQLSPSRKSETACLSVPLCVLLASDSFLMI